MTTDNGNFKRNILKPNTPDIWLNDSAMKMIYPNSYCHNYN